MMRKIALVIASIIVLISVIGLAKVSALSPTFSFDNNLKTKWTFEDITNLNRSDEGLHNWTEGDSSAVFSVTGIIGFGLNSTSATGASPFRNPIDNATLRTGFEGTWSMWIREVQHPTAQLTFLLFMNALATSNDTNMWINDTRGIQVRYIRDTGVTYFLNDSGVLPLDTWTHVAMTWNDTGWSLYRNGLLTASRTGINVNVPTFQSSAIQLGGTNSGGAYSILFDDVRIYNVSLNSTQVLEINNTIPVSTGSLPFVNKNCYQEFANVSTTCGGLSTGNYRVANITFVTPSALYDGDFNTGTTSTVSTFTSDTADLYINYTKPANAVTSFWQTKCGLNINYTQNTTIPSDCFNSIIELEMQLGKLDIGDPFGDGWFCNFYCKNTTGWKLINRNSYNLNIPSMFYEEGMTWIINQSAENGFIYNPSTTSGASESFAINISYNNTYYTSITPSFIYNGTVYPTTQIGTGDTLVFNSTITIPIVSTLESKEFYWSFILQNSSGSNSLFNSTSHFQTVNFVTIDNCTSATFPLYNLSLYDEDTRSNLNGTIEVNFLFFSPETMDLIGNFSRTFNYLVGSENARICISNTNQSYRVDYTIKYNSNSTYSTEYKYSQNNMISNSTQLQNIKLYDLLLSRATPFTINVVDQFLLGLPRAVVDVQRQYIPSNQFVSVESPLTDSSGNAIAHLVSKEIYYNFVVSQDGVILGTFNNYQVACQNEATGQCTITLSLVNADLGLQDYTQYGGIFTAFNFNRNARILTMLYESADGNVHNVSWSVLVNDGYANNTVCNSESIGSSGSLSCNVPISYGNSSIVATVYSDSVFITNAFYSFGMTSTEIFGGARVVLGLLMYGTIVLLMIANPVTMVIGAILGMVFMTLFHIVDGGSLVGNTSIVIWFIIAGGTILVMLRNKV